MNPLLIIQIGKTLGDVIEALEGAGSRPPSVTPDMLAQKAELVRLLAEEADRRAKEVADGSESNAEESARF